MENRGMARFGRGDNCGTGTNPWVLRHRDYSRAID